MRTRRGLVASIAAALVVLLIILVSARHAVARILVSQILSAASGYHVSIGEMRLQSDHGAFLDTHVSKNGEPVLDAQRVDVYYHLRDLLPGSRHRFGFLGVSIDRPQITIIHHADGSYNITQGRPSGNVAPGQTHQNGTPLDYYAKIKDGQATLRNDAAFYKESRVIAIFNINGALSVKSDDRTHYVVTGDLFDTKAQPFRAAGTIDYHHQFAIHHLSAAAVPIKAIGNYIINSPAAHILAGTAKRLDARAYALGVTANGAVDYHVSARADVSDGQMYIQGLAKPLDNIHGVLQVFDGGLAARALGATIAGIPLRVAGSIFNFSDPQFFLGVQGAAPLRTLKTILAFGSHYPVTGNAAFQTLIEGPIAAPLILVGFSAPQVNYAAVPLTGASGVAALYQNVFSIVPLRGHYGPIALSAFGRLQLGEHVRSEIAVNYGADAASVPYLNSLAPGSQITGEATLHGTDVRYAIDGYLSDAYDPMRVNAFYQLSPQGTGTIGPLEVSSPDTGSLIASYAIDRPHNSSAFWASARNLRLAPARAVALPGFALPGIPHIDAQIASADLAGGGTGSDITVAGTARATGLHVANVAINALDATFAGDLANVQLRHATASGPWGTFSGNGAYTPRGLLARGTYDGSFEALQPYTGNLGAHGGVHGPIALEVGPNHVLVQTEGTQFTHAFVRGIPVESMGGTVAIDNGHVNVYAGQARLDGADIVVAGSLAPGQTLGVESINAGPQVAQTFGIPLEAGSVSLVGAVGMRGAMQTFSGDVSVANGRAQGFPLSGSSEVEYNGNDVHVSNATVIVDQTYGALDGDVLALHSGAPRYALRADVPVGDIAPVAHSLHLPTYGAVGTFAADLAIGGSGRSPSVSGPLSIPVGQINGLNFGDASTQLRADSHSVSARDGRVAVGSTRATFAALLHGSSSVVDVRSHNANLSDFNDLFDTGDTLAGTAPILAISVARTPGRISTSAHVDVDDFRYRRLPIGDTDAVWTSRDGVARGSLNVGGEHGRLGVSGSVALAPAPSVQDVIARSQYAVHARLRGLDLTTWLPAFGFPTVPMTGRVDANASVNGRFPHLALAGDANLKSGTFGRIPVDQLSLRAHSAPGDRVAVDDVHLSLHALRATGGGSFGLAPSAPIALDLSVQSSDLPGLSSNFLRTPLDVHGNLDSSISLRGTTRAPSALAGVDLTKATIEGVAVPQLVASLAFNGKDIAVRNAEVSLDNGQITLAGALPLQLMPFGVGPPHAPLSLDFFSRGVELADFAPVLPKGTSLTGVVDGRIGLGGTVGTPKIFGSLALRDGSYKSPLETAPITQTVAQMTFENTTASLQRLHAQLGRGTLDANGTITFDRGSASDQVRYALDAVTKGARLSFPTYGTGTLDSQLHLVKTVGLAKLSGEATLSDGVIPFAALIPKSADPAATGAPAGPPINLALDLGLTAGKNVAVRANALGFGLDIGAKGHVGVAGTLLDPRINGRFDSAGGTLTFVDHSFKVQQGSVTFDPSSGVVPQIYAVGTAHVTNPDPNPQRNPTGSADITITVSGPATNPNLNFTSDPAGYSRDQILALLTPLGAVTGIQFDASGNPVPQGSLAGAPAPGSGQPLPAGAVARQNGSISVGEEAFNILNAQFAHSLLAPIENVLGGSLGLSDLNLTVGYNGTVGLSFRRPISNRLSAVYANSFGFPSRQTFGMVYQPNEFTSAQLTFFSQTAPALIFNNPAVGVSYDPRVTAGQPIGGSSGFTFAINRLFP